MVLQNGCPRVKPKNLLKLSVGKLNRFSRLCNLAWGRGLWVFSLSYFNDILVFSSFLFLHKIYQSFDKKKGGEGGELIDIFKQVKGFWDIIINKCSAFLGTR